MTALPPFYQQGTVQPLVSPPLEMMSRLGCTPACRFGVAQVGIDDLVFYHNGTRYPINQADLHDTRIDLWTPIAKRIAAEHGVPDTTNTKAAVRQYRKKPVVIEAVCWDGTNTAEVLAFTENRAFHVPFHEEGHPGGSLMVPTLEGNRAARIGDFIIKGVQGEFYPCKPDIFEATYEPA